MAKKEKVTVIVLDSFRDKYDHKTQYPVGAELNVTKDRAEDLLNRGLARIKETTPPKGSKQPKDISTAENAGKETADKNEAFFTGDNPETKSEDEQQGTEE